MRVKYLFSSKVMTEEGNYQIFVNSILINLFMKHSIRTGRSATIELITNNLQVQVVDHNTNK